VRPASQGPKKYGVRPTPHTPHHSVGSEGLVVRLYAPYQGHDLVGPAVIRIRGSGIRIEINDVNVVLGNFMGTALRQR